MTNASDPVACVLAGGRSRRLGRAKAAVLLAGRPLLDYPLEALRACGFEPVVVAKPDSTLPPLASEVWLEQEERSHPLAGILTALERARGAPVLVCACDVPFVTPSLLGEIAATEGPVVVPSAGGRLHPLVARYEPATANALAASLDAELSIHDTIAALSPVTIGEDALRRFGEPQRLLFNVNTRADLERAEELVRER